MNPKSRGCPKNEGGPHRWLREWPGGHVRRADCHYCGVEADATTVKALDEDFQRGSATPGLYLGGVTLDDN